MTTATARHETDATAPINGAEFATPTAPDRDSLERELDALRRDVVARLGENDVTHIRNVMLAANTSELGGRALLQFGWGPVTFVLGTGALALSKILENMEIGHNVIHGQYDWTGDPALRSDTYEWDIACTSADWRRYHNYEHHTYTNILNV